MGTQLLRSQHCLTSPLETKSMRGLHQETPRPGGRRKRWQTGDVECPAVKFPNLVMGQVTILKRGEDLKRWPVKPDLPLHVQEKEPVVSGEEKKPKVEEKKPKVEEKKPKVEEKKPKVEEKKPKVEENKQKFEHEGAIFCSTERLGPEPELVPKHIRITEAKSVGAVEVVYAGSGFVTSPAPSALPLPAFFTRGCQKIVNSNRATKDLRRLLGLDLIQ